MGGRAPSIPSKHAACQAAMLAEVGGSAARSRLCLVGVLGVPNSSTLSSSGEECVGEEEVRQPLKFNCCLILTATQTEQW